jgi:hypothetical protein
MDSGHSRSFKEIYRAAHSNSIVMRSLFFQGLLSTLLTSCATAPEAEDPADLIAPGQSISRLRALDWAISPAIKVEEAESRDGLTDSEDWQRFKSRMRPDDALRPVRHNAGIGYAIFRDGALLDMFLVVVF